MVEKRKNENDVQRLARGAPTTRSNARRAAQGKSFTRARTGRDIRGMPADARRPSPLARLIPSLGEEKVRFQVVGMTAAVMQGVMANTLDTDICLDLPTRQYMRLLNLIRSQRGLGSFAHALRAGRWPAREFSVRGNGAGKLFSRASSCVDAQDGGSDREGTASVANPSKQRGDPA